MTTEIPVSTKTPKGTAALHFLNFHISKSLLLSYGSTGITNGEISHNSFVVHVFTITPHIPYSNATIYGTFR